MLPTIKIYKMDWNFLIQNYLDQKLWSKDWTLFEYKGFKISISLYNIYTKNEKIYFEITLTHKEPDSNFITTKTKQIDYSLKIDEVKFLKKKINSAIWELLVQAECDWYIKYEEEWDKLDDMKEEERERLTAIAEEFLDDHDVTNENIREAYIEAYVDEYERTYQLLRDYEESRRYNALPDLFLVWLDSLEEDDKAKRQTLKEKLGSEKLEKVRQEISEYQKYMETSEWEEDMKSNLEEV